MNRKWVWGGFGALLFFGILSGYVPDMMLASARRGARAEGLLDLPRKPKIASKDDARGAYRKAAERYPNGPMQLRSTSRVGFGPGTIPKPASASAHGQLDQYLAAVAQASRLQACSPLSTDWNQVYTGGSEVESLFRAGKALADRAKDEAGLLPPMRVGRHLKESDGIEAAAYGAYLAVHTLDRASKLDLPADARRRLAAAYGAPLGARETLRRHVAQEVAEWDRETQEFGMSVGRTRREAGYLRYWRGFFAKAPKDEKGFAEAARREDEAMTRAENDAGGYLDLSSIFGATTNLWGDWAGLLAKAERRVKAGR